MLRFFDLDFFIHNSRDAIFTLRSIFRGVQFFYVILFIIIFAICFFYFLKNIKIKNTYYKKYFKNIVLILGFIFLGISFIQFYFRYEKCVLFDFAGTLFIKKDAAYRQYNQDYLSIVSRYNNFSLNNFQYGDDVNLPDIYFIHLESVNGDFLQESLINNFKQYSNENGSIFTNFYSNTIQTLRSQESILCALPPSLMGYFQYEFNAKQIICIPKVLSNIGYRTLFFKSHNLQFADTGRFMSDIGFEEIHSGDIMQDEDVIYRWGYREDIFYKRAWNYINNLNDKKKFVYIAISSTNHYPFIVYDKKGEVPFKEAKTFTDRLRNTVYVQDQYLSILLDELKKDKKYKYVFLFSDHSWPIGIHENNIFNENFGYKENFYIPFSFMIFGEDKNINLNINNSVKAQYSQIDFFKTILDLLNIKTNNKYLGNSFYFELLKDGQYGLQEKNCSISLQPFADKYITFFYNNSHYIYNIKKRRAYYFNLLNDFKEEWPINISQKAFLDVYEDCKSVAGY